jgi:hypothetical protein
MPSRCEFIDPNNNERCKTEPSYRNPEDTIGYKRCAKHKLEGMVRKQDGRMCIHPDHVKSGISTRATFNESGTGTPLYCFAHSEGMKTITKKCTTAGCQKSCLYGFDTATKCTDHKTENMRLMYGACPCGKYTIFGFIGGKVECCKKCKLEGMIDIKNRKCVECKRLESDISKQIQPTFGYVNGKPTHCKNHMLNDMTDLRHKKETCLDCNIRSTYGFIQYKPLYCVFHKKDGMKDVVSRKCSKCKILQPCFNYKGMTHIYCNACKDDGMVDTKNKRCEKCSFFMVSKLNNDGKRLCSCCSESPYKKSKELSVVSFLTKNNIDFVHNKKCRYNQFFPDIKIKTPTHTIIVEIDEFQHKYNNYDEINENIRMECITKSEMKPCVFIRYNPDIFRFNGVKKNITSEKRCEMLLEMINKHMTNIPTKYLHVYRMFYDVVDINNKIIDNTRDTIDNIIDTTDTIDDNTVPNITTKVIKSKNNDNYNDYIVEYDPSPIIDELYRQCMIVSQEDIQDDNIQDGNSQDDNTQNDNSQE